MKIDQVQTRINEKYPEENLEVLNYDGMKLPCTIECLECKNSYTLKYAQNFFLKNKGRVCQHCVRNKIDIFKKSYNRFLTWHEEDGFKKFLFDDNQKINNSRDLPLLTCKNCGRENRKSIYEYMDGVGCGCEGLGGRQKSHEEFLEQISHIDITPLEKYVSAHKRIKVRHTCGFIWKATPNNLINGKGCPVCNRKISKGEKEVSRVLRELGISFVREKPVLIEGHRLRFDFFLKDYKTFIEFQGRQHFEPVNFFGGEEQFKKQTHYDGLKVDHSRRKGYDLILFDTEDMDDIEKTLVQRLNVDSSESKHCDSQVE